MQSSGQLTVGTPDANGATASSVGYALYTVLTGDVQLKARITDVRRSYDVGTVVAGTNVSASN